MPWKYIFKTRHIVVYHEQKDFKKSIEEIDGIVNFRLNKMVCFDNLRLSCIVSNQVAV